MVYAQVAAAVRDRHKAEDLTQETFLAAWKGLAALRAESGGGIVAWLLTLVCLPALLPPAARPPVAEPR